ncbi:DUF3135 domain-containing protein [Pelotalea chapellei]|uniref:DUF3135 domain-containing protein n=1 Tax=Pelotalea chapellei TaxID=44671 RepID=A0ABS5U916_9BACT|nr:DUF3135 domain-containing protein [Pelotalea chapellei]MBT1072160.1 DUF3135 domain-containing protein [Pelotalea chapellei]
MHTDLQTEFRDYTPDGLSELYKKDPTYFDELAAAAIHQACIGKTEKETTKLRQMQWSIEGQLRKAKTPLQRMQIMENIFYSRIFGQDGELAQLSYGCKRLLDAVCVQDPATRPKLSLLNGGRNEGAKGL